MVRSLCRLGELISMLENRYREHWTIRRMARIAAMAPSTLLPVFKKVTGFSPVQYLLFVRLDKAAELLRGDENPISEVAAACGFTDSNYFSRQFRRRFGRSPRDYRREA